MLVVVDVVVVVVVLDVDVVEVDEEVEELEELELVELDGGLVPARDLMRSAAFSVQEVRPPQLLAKPLACDRIHRRAGVSSGYER